MTEYGILIGGGGSGSTSSFSQILTTLINFLQTPSGMASIVVVIILFFVFKR